MRSHLGLLASGLLALCSLSPQPGLAQRDRPTDRPMVRPDATQLRPPPGGTMEQVLRGDQVFHGEVARGQCSVCHGVDAKGTGNGNDLTVGMWIWSDGSLKMLKATIQHNMAIAPGMDGELQPADVDAVAAYVWAIGHQAR